MIDKDTVYRQDAINAVMCGALSAATIYGRTDEGRTALYETVRAIKALPSAQPERKTGHLHLLDECTNAGYYCSECHKKIVKDGWSKTAKKIKFCPNCGCELEVEA